MLSSFFQPCFAISLTLVEAYAAPLLISALVVGAVIAALRWWTQSPAFSPPPKQPPVEQASAPADVDPQLLAVLAAAYAVIGQPVVVRRVTFVGPSTVSAWAEVGRVQIQGSHNLNR